MSKISRRDFLRLGSGLALGLSFAQLSGCGNDAATQLATSNQAIGQLPWASLQRQLQGQLLLPGAAGFDQTASAVWNLLFASVRPAGIVRALSSADVSAALQWAQANGVAVVARAGGHSYGGYSTTTGLLLDVSLMNQIQYNADNCLAVVGGGARNRDAYAALRAPSVAITHGRCAAVGIAGLTLGGGIGFNMRAHGLTCDALVETEVVTADGTVLVCNDHSNSDLFWACRGGGGGNFGVHTSFTFQTFPVTTVTAFKISWTSNQRQVMAILMDILLASPNALGAKLSATVQQSAGANAITVTLQGQLVGSPTELKSMLAPAYILSPPSAEMINLLSYWDGQDILSEAGPPELSHERSRYVYQPISSAGLDTIFQYLQNYPGSSVAGTWKIFLQGGAVSNVDPAATAYVHRRALMLSSAEIEWTDSDSAALVALNQKWVNEFHAAMEPFTSDECYQNFIDGAQSDYLRAYYGSNLERLIAVKNQYDPKNVFNSPQSIPLQLPT